MSAAGQVTLLGAAWDDPASLGYPAVFGLVLLGSVVPVVPTGLVVGGAAAVATSAHTLSLPLVVLAAALGALAGDVITFAVARFGGPAAVRWVSRGQHADRIGDVREQFRTHGWQVVVVGRLLPAGRIPVLLAAGALAYPWRRLLPASLAAGLVWAVAYALIGVVSGGIFDSPLVATLLATVLVHPRSFAPPGEIVGAEQLHRVLRGWLTDLGHPEPAGDLVPAADADEPAPLPTPA